MLKLYPKVFVFFLCVCFSTCKKGEEDPTISLRTRKARVTGEWRMTSGKASYTAPAYNESYTFDGTNVKMNTTGVIYTGKYSLSLTMDKDGSFTCSELLGNSKFKAEGHWNFNTGVGEDKKKENLVFDLDKINEGLSLGNNLFNRLSSHFMYRIVELRNKKIVIHAEGKIYSATDGSYATLSNDYTLEPQK